MKKGNIYNSSNFFNCINWNNYYDKNNFQNSNSSVFHPVNLKIFLIDS